MNIIVLLLFLNLKTHTFTDFTRNLRFPFPFLFTFILQTTISKSNVNVNWIKIFRFDCYTRFCGRSYGKLGTYYLQVIITFLGIVSLVATLLKWRFFVFFTVALVLFLVPAGGSNPAGPITYPCGAIT